MSTNPGGIGGYTAPISKKQTTHFWVRDDVMITTIRSTVGTALAVIASLALVSAPVSARSSYVQDGAQLFSASTVSDLNAKISAFNQQTGKEILVVTVPSLNGASASTTVENVFAQQQVNGILIFLSKTDRVQTILGDRASRAFFPAGSFDAVRQAMRGYFRSGDFDGGITTGVDLLLGQYRSHAGSLRGAVRQSNGAPITTPASTSSNSMLGGGFMSIVWLALILIAGFLIIRAIFRAISRPRMMPPGYGGQGGPGMGGPGMMGGPGYGGYGYGGGGGGFFSGLLGGLGGAFLGNELFGRQNSGGFGDQSGIAGGAAGGGALGGNPGDAGGWQSDPGQADMGNASSGDFGGSGGGADFGGGGGGDFGGGGGDSGGGW